MKIYQIVSTLNFGDAIGNDVIAIKHVIEDMGIKTFICAESISDKIKENGVFSLDRMPKLSDDDIVIYHMGSGAETNSRVASMNCRKIMRYHNITPPEFFDMDDPVASEHCRKGLEDMERVMRGRFNAHVTVSGFNKSCMVEMGYSPESIDVIPIIVPFEDYRKTPDEEMVRKLSDGIVNIVFVGRIAPNKKHEDIIRSFAYYKKYINPKSRLILAGSCNEDGVYYNDLLEYIDVLGVQDVVFPGHISFEELLAIYKTAHVFLCMSEHEGFCVPLLEAMTFDVPIIAYDSCAVPETMGGSGIVTDSKEPAFVARIIDRLVKDNDLRSKVIGAQQERLKRFDYETIKKEFQEYLRRFMEKFPPLSPDSPSENLSRLYDIVDENMKKAGKDTGFTREALLACAGRCSGDTDVTALLNSGLYDMPVRAVIETVYTAFFNMLPDEKGYEDWGNAAKNMEKDEFIRHFVSTAANSRMRKDKGTRVRYNPFADAEPIQKGGTAAT